MLLRKVKKALSCKYYWDFVIVSIVSGIWRSNAVHNTTVNLSWTELDRFSATELNPVSSLLLCRSDSAADKIRWVCFPLTLYLDRCDCTYHASGLVGPAMLSPHLARPARPTCDTDSRLCPPTKVSECALHRERPAVNTVASHGMPLFAFIGQTTSDTNRALWAEHYCLLGLLWSF